MGGAARRRRSRQDAADPARQYHHRWRGRGAGARWPRKWSEYLASDLVFYRAVGPCRPGRAAGSGLGPRARVGARCARRALRAGGGNRLRHAARAGAGRCRRRHSARAVAARRGAFDDHAHGLGVDRVGSGGRRPLGRCGLGGGPCRRGLEHGFLGPRRARARAPRISLRRNAGGGARYCRRRERSARRLRYFFFSVP